MLVSKNQLILKQAFKHVTAGIGYFLYRQAGGREVLAN